MPAGSMATIEPEKDSTNFMNDSLRLKNISEKGTPELRRGIAYAQTVIIPKAMAKIPQTVISMLIDFLISDFGLLNCLAEA